MSRHRSRNPYTYPAKRYSYTYTTRPCTSTGTSTCTGRLHVVLLVVTSILLSACRRDMQDQPRYDPLEHSAFFGDQRAARPLVAGTVARGHLDEDDAFFRGQQGNAPLENIPIELDQGMIKYGQQRYDIYCSPCHDRVGTGHGMIVLRGLKPPPSFHEERLREAPAGYFFQVITNGFGVMSSYAAQIPARDRWAIIAYVRALQLSQHATLEDVPAAERARLETERGQP